MTNEDKKLILEWCGVIFDKDFLHWRCPDGIRYSLYPPDKPIEPDMSFYFKYAVPKLKFPYISFQMGESSIWHQLENGDVEVATAYSEDPAEAFGQALLKLIKEKK